MAWLALWTSGTQWMLKLVRYNFFLQIDRARGIFALEVAADPEERAAERFDPHLIHERLLLHHFHQDFASLSSVAYFRKNAMGALRWALRMPFWVFKRT
jgi:hypothetical protein